MTLHWSARIDFGARVAEIITIQDSSTLWEERIIQLRLSASWAETETLGLQEGSEPVEAVQAFTPCSEGSYTFQAGSAVEICPKRGISRMRVLLEME